MAARWIACRPNFLVHVQRARTPVPRQVPDDADRGAREGRLKFFSTHAGLADKARLQALPGAAAAQSSGWSTARSRSRDQRQVLRYLSRYTHRVAISNRRLVSADDGGVTFRWKDYRIDGPGRWKTMTLTPHEFIRRFLHARAAERLPSHPPLRPVRQWQSRREHRQGARAARRAPRAKEPEEPQRPISPAHCRVPVPAAAGACSSSRPSPPAASPSIGRSDHADDQDRHLMMTCNDMLDAMPPLHDAGSRPAMRALAPMRKINTHPARRSRRPNKSSEHRMAPMRCLVIDHLCSGRNQLHPPCHRARLNRHRARCTVGASSSATSCIAGLPTPAVGACGCVSSWPASANLYSLRT